MGWKRDKPLLITLVLLFIFFTVINLFFRDTVEDETEYIKEALVLSDCIRHGQWFGNYSVGLHGFLLKIPAAIIFMFSGPNIFLIRSINVIFSLANCILFYKILDSKKINLSKYKFIGVILFISSFQFLTTTPTFIKESSLLFFILLFIYELLNKKRFWLLGLFLLLIFDAKEYVAFVISPAIGLWLIISRQKNFILRSIQIFFPTIIFTVLMFTTSLVPLNPFVASIIKLTNDSQYQNRHFSVEYSTANLQLYTTNEKVLSQNMKIYQIVISYVQKILYPKVFSLLSLPLIIVIPSLATSIILFNKWRKTKKYELMLLPLIFWIYLIVYVFYTSIGRYLYPIFPIIYIFFLFLIKNNKIFSKPILLTIISTSGILTILDVFYDQGFLYIKALLYLCFFIGLILISFDKFKKLSFLYIYCFCLVSFASTFIFFITQDQIANSLNWGIDRECQEIIKELPENGKILINEFGWKQLPNIYINETYNLPEWQWPLKDWVPKKTLLKTIGDQKIYNNLWSTEEELKKIIEFNNIEYLVFIESSLTDNKFYRQGTVNFALGLEWTKLEKVKTYKNKYIYILKIINPKDNKNQLNFKLKINKNTDQKNLGTLFSIKNNYGKEVISIGLIEPKKNNNKIIMKIKNNIGVSCPINWKNESILRFKIDSNLIIIYQDDNFICKTILNNIDYDHIKNKVTIGNGIYGRLNGSINLIK
ncbi:MAG: hypothetical protein PHP97_01335 [Candidatus Shapirobacteria bacterium]|nr:hypothetical protein [Candidatus Shapirobacteria bacterium]MDD4383221.1 hypothetical protein [Candidatus Shapirobacteria bacterium]